MGKRLVCAMALVVLTAPAPGAGAAEWSRAGDIPGSVGTGFPFDADIGGRGRVAVAIVRQGMRVIVRAPGGRWGPPNWYRAHA